MPALHALCFIAMTKAKSLLSSVLRNNSSLIIADLSLLECDQDSNSILLAMLTHGRLPTSKNKASGSYVNIFEVIRMFRISNVALQYPLGRHLASALFCTALAACGGGGDGSGESTAAGTNTQQGASAGNTPSPSPVVGGASANQPTLAAATDARFNAPKGVTFDTAGNLYVVDSGNNTIRKITPAGAVSTIAGTPGVQGSADGSGAAAQFNSPVGIAADASGNLYVVDAGNGTIRKIAPSGLVTTLAGTPGVKGNADGAGAAAQFNQPWGIAADAAGNVYVADTENYLIRKISPSGVVSTLAGIRGTRGAADGNAQSATFLGPRGIAIDSAGNLYVTDWFGPPAPNLAETSTLVRKITPEGNVSTMAGNISNGPTPAQFSDTFAIAADAAGNAYVAAAASVRRIAANGSVATLAEGSAFASLMGVTLDGAGNLYVADEYRHVIDKLTQSGSVTVFAGKSGESGSIDTSR
jgi:hypothetical protein